MFTLYYEILTNKDDNAVEFVIQAPKEWGTFSFFW